MIPYLFIFHTLKIICSLKAFLFCCPLFAGSDFLILDYSVVYVTLLSFDFSCEPVEVGTHKIFLIFYLKQCDSSQLIVFLTKSNDLPKIWRKNFVKKSSKNLTPRILFLPLVLTTSLWSTMHGAPIKNLFMSFSVSIFYERTHKLLFHQRNLSQSFRQQDAEKLVSSISSSCFFTAWKIPCLSPFFHLQFWTSNVSYRCLPNAY